MSQRPLDETIAVAESNGGSETHGNDRFNSVPSPLRANKFLSTNLQISVSEEARTISGWITDTAIAVAVAQGDGADASPIDILVLPGNPGILAWYIPLLRSLARDVARRLGRTVRAHGISLAGHGTSDDRLRPVAGGEDGAADCRTVDGQVVHLERALRDLARRMRAGGTGPPLSDLVLVGHSIGCHILQRLCVSHAGRLGSGSGGGFALFGSLRVRHVMYLMPFIRFDPGTLPRSKSLPLVMTGRGDVPPKLLQAVIRRASRHVRDLPEDRIKAIIRNIFGGDTFVESDVERAIDVTYKYATSPDMLDNWGYLGLDEMRRIPENYDVRGLSVMAKSVVCPLSDGAGVHMLYCGDGGRHAHDVDQWAPASAHLPDLIHLVEAGELPRNVRGEEMPGLRHDFVVRGDRQLVAVTGWCVRSIAGAMAESLPLLSPRPASKL